MRCRIGGARGRVRSLTETRALDERLDPPSWRATSGVPDGAEAAATAGAGTGEAAEVGLAMLCDLLAAALASGCSVPRALRATGAAVGGERGAALGRAGSGLVLGASWDEAWRGAPDALSLVATVLRPSWEQGTAPVPALRAAAQTVRRTVQSRAIEAAARLGVRLVLPIGLCHLPAFVLLGIVPVVLAVAGASFG